MKKAYFRSIKAIALILLLLANTSPSFAKKYSDKKLRSFIIANSATFQLQKRFKEFYSVAQSPEKKKEVVENFNKNIRDIMGKAGITVDEYNAISTEIKSDAKLKKQVNKAADKISKELEKNQKKK